jgi:sulfate permease, SulP family
VRLLHFFKHYFFLIPLIGHLKGYSLAFFLKDLRAGINVALLDFPQGMAYAMIAGLPVQCGIYSSAIGSLTGPIFGSSRFLMLGPTNASAVLLLSGFLSLGLPEEQKLLAMPLLILMVAMIMFAGTLLRAEIAIQYVSRCVITGYITAAAFLIIVNQIKYILDLSVEKSGTFYGTLINTVQQLPSTSLKVLCFSACTFAVYYSCSFLLKKIPTVALTLVIMALLNLLLGHYTGTPLTTLQGLASGSWPFTVPIFDFELINKLLGTAFAIAFLSLLESSSIAKSLAAQAGDTVNVRQQMVSMGVADVCNAFGGGMPVSGSLTRSMLNWKSGAVSPVSSIISGSILVVGVLALGFCISYIPIAALASLVIIVGFSLIRIDTIRLFLTVSRTDAITFLVTFLGGLLLSLDKAIYFGVGLSILFFLIKVARPKVVALAFNQRGELSETIEQKSPAISIVQIEGDFFFGSTDAFLDQVRAQLSVPGIKVFIIRMLNAYHIDASAALALRELIQFARKEGQEVLISGIRPDVRRVLERAGVIALLGEKNAFYYATGKVTVSTRGAVHRAHEILGIPEDQSQTVEYSVNQVWNFSI